MKKRILIVEDNIVIAYHLKLLIESIGCEVLTTERGEEVINHIRNHQPAIVLMDIMLAGDMNGFEAAELIRKEAEAPIIFMSALTDVNVKNTMNNIHNTYMFAKPFDETEVLGLIKNLLSIENRA